MKREDNAVLSRVWILFVAGMLCTIETVRAEFQVGDRIPAFSLRTPDESTVRLSFEGDRLVFENNGTRVQPTALVIQLFQPDCLQCRAQLVSLKGMRSKFSGAGRAVFLGVAHRGDPEDVGELARELNVGFPLVMGVGSDLARQFAAGDTLGIIDEQGLVRFAQVGYGDGDERLWFDAVEALRSGKPVKETGIDRDRLAIGDHLPAIKLPSLRSGKVMALIGKEGRLTFRDDSGKETHPKAAVGFFSRY